MIKVLNQCFMYTVVNGANNELSQVNVRINRWEWKMSVVTYPNKSIWFLKGSDCNSAIYALSESCRNLCQYIISVKVLRQIFVQFVFTVRRYALHGLSYRNSVRPSVTLVHCVHMVQPTIMISSPYGSHIILVSGDIKVHPKIRRGSPRARALNEGGVGTNWRFSTNKPPYLRNGARYDKGYY